MKHNLCKQVFYSHQQDRRNRAQNLVEFAIILPILLFVLFGIVEIVRIMQSWLLIENSVREGASYASSLDYKKEYCSDGNCNQDEIYDARLRSIHDAIWVGSSGIYRLKEGEASPNQENFFKSLVCLERDLIVPDVPSGIYTCGSEMGESWEGEGLVVLIQYNHSFIVPLFFMKDSFLRMMAIRNVNLRYRTE